MLSVLTVERVGASKGLNCMDMFHSSPEGEDTRPLVNFFLGQKPTWSFEFSNKAEDVILLRDSLGDLWVAQSVVYEGVCIVEHN